MGVNKLVAIDVEKQRKAQKRVDAERRAIIKEIVRKIDEFMSKESDGSVETTNHLTRVLLTDAMEPSIINDPVMDVKFARQITSLVNNIIVFDHGMNGMSSVARWIRMQVAMQLVERMSTPFNEALREHDRNN